MGRRRLRLAVHGALAARLRGIVPDEDIRPIAGRARIGWTALGLAVTSILALCAAGLADPDGVRELVMHARARLHDGMAVLDRVWARFRDAVT